jgi:hypothetical protein
MAVGDVVMYGVSDDMATAINGRYDANLHAVTGEARPALVLNEASGKSNQAVFPRTGRTWLVRQVVQAAAGTAGACWPRA